MKYKIEVYYKVFNLFCRDKEVAAKHLDGWEHKEKMTKVYGIVPVDNVPDEINGDTDFFPHSTEYEVAERILEEDNDY